MLMVDCRDFGRLLVIEVALDVFDRCLGSFEVMMTANTDEVTPGQLAIAPTAEGPWTTG